AAWAACTLACRVAAEIGPPRLRRGGDRFRARTSCGAPLCGRPLLRRRLHPAAVGFTGSAGAIGRAGGAGGRPFGGGSRLDRGRLRSPARVCDQARRTAVRPEPAAWLPGVAGFGGGEAASAGIIVDDSAGNLPGGMDMVDGIGISI